MRTLFENVFREQLKRIFDELRIIPTVDIGFDYTDTDFVYNVGISAGGKRASVVMRQITVDGIKHMVDIIIREYRDTPVEAHNRYECACNTLTINPYVTHWDGEIRDSGTTLMEQLQEVCNG